MYKPKKIFNNGATMHGHKFPATRGFLIQICINLRRILQKNDATTRSIGLRSTKPKNFRPKSPTTRSHNLSNDPRPRPSKLCKSAHNLRKVTIPGSSTALDLQDLKISGQESQTRASTRHQKVRWSPVSFHALLCADKDLSRSPMRRQAPTRISHALNAPTRYTHQTLTRAFSAMTSCMTSSPTDPVWPIHPNPVWTACKKN